MPLAVGLCSVLLCASCASSGKPSSSAVTGSVEQTTTTATTPAGPVVRTGEQQLPPLYAQGVARVPGGWIFSGTNSLWKTDDALAELMHTGPSIPDAWKAKGFDHIGDIDVVGKYVYAPFEEPDYSKGEQATARFDRDSLRFVDAVTVPQHENSFVTIDPKTMIAYTMNHFDGGAVLRYDVTNRWQSLPPLKLSQVLHRTQGGDVALGQLWISTDDPAHGVYRVDLQTGATSLVVKMGHPGGEGEGIDATQLPSGLLHVMCVDPKYTPVWFEHIHVPVS
jgi:hypothetical protein